MVQIVGTLYDASDVVDKTLIAKIDLPVYNGYPSGNYTPAQIGTIKAGQVAGVVYSWLDADPTVNRPQLWWMFYPGGISAGYYYIPHGAGYFDISTLTEQGVLSVAQKNAEPETWYEKVLHMVLPVIVISVVGAAAVRGYFSSRK